MKNPISFLISTLALAGSVTAQTTLVEETFTYADGDVSVVGTGGIGWDVVEGGWQVGDSTAGRRFVVSSGQALYNGDGVNQFATRQPRTFAAPVSTSATETITISYTLQLLETLPGRGIGIMLSQGGTTVFMIGKEVNGPVGLHDDWYNSNTYVQFTTTGATETIEATLTYDGTDTSIVLSDSDETLVPHTVAGVLTIDGIKLFGYHQSTISNGVDDILVTTSAGGPGTPYCFGNTSEGNPCPCGNDNDGSAPLGGCAHGSSSAGAHLDGSGVASVGSDSLVLHGKRGQPSNAGLFVQALNDLDGQGIFIGDGIRCAGGTLKRLKVAFADVNGDSDTTGVSQGLWQRSSDVGYDISPGETIYYYWWIRDTAGSPCGSDNNSSNGYAITWLP